MTKRIDITDYGAVNGGEVLCTTAIQQAIDKAAELECEVYVPEGIYLTGALFLKSNMSLNLAKGATLLGTTEGNNDPIKRICVVGAEIQHPTGIINVFRASHVRVQGAGVIEGQGFSNVIVHECSDIQLEGFHSVCSGSPNIQICCSENVCVKGLTISDNNDPGTDGIDIDSCNGVLVEKCKISCNDDSVCIKSGCAADGLRRNRICANIMVRDCEILEGAGITLGSETAGGMRNISICDNTFQGTRHGFHIKFVPNCGGMIEEVEVTNLKMEDVHCCFCFEFDGNSAYGDGGITHAGNVRISKVTSTISEACQETVRAFAIEGMPEAPFEDFVFEDMHLQVMEYGKIKNVKNLRFIDVALDILS